MRRISVKLSDEELEQLIALAERERRETSDQASLLVARGLAAEALGTPEQDPRLAAHSPLLHQET